MHGVIHPQNNGMQGEAGSTSARLKAAAYANRFFLCIVILPTLIAAAYLYLVASDQYESSTDFVIRHAEATANSGNMGQLFGISLGSSSTISESFIVEKYLLSHDAVAMLRREDDLVRRFRPAGVDWFSRLWSADPTPERLLKYYKKQVEIEQDETSGITHLTVHSFRPEDSYALTSKLLRMGEQQINEINKRTYRDQVASAKHDLNEAASQLGAIQARLTGFRKSRDDVDPEGTGRAQLTLVTNLTASLVQARAQLRAVGQAVSHSSPQYIALQRQVQALEAQIAGQSSQLTNTDNSVASRLGDYEQLVIEREEAAKLHAATAAQYAQAVAEAKRKQLYLVRVVEPNRPVKSQFPERGKMVLTIFASLFFAYAIGWLLWAGVKEHSI